MNISAWRYYSKFYQGKYRMLLLSIVVSIVQSFFVLPIVLLVRYIFDEIIPAGDFHLLMLIGSTILLLYLLNAGVSLWTRYVILKITKIAIQRLRDDLLKRIYTFSRTYHSNVDRSELHTNIIQDTHRLDNMSNALVVQLLPSLVASITICAVLIFLNWFLFLIMISIAPLFFLVSRTMGKMIKKRVQAYHSSFKTLSKGMLFVLQMMDLTMIQSAEHFEIDRQRKNLEELRITSGSMAWLQNAYSIVQNAIFASSCIVILIIGGAAILSGTMTIGELLSFYVAVALLKKYLGPVLSSIPQIIEGNESLVTLFNIQMTKNSMPYSGRKRITFKGKITFESVYFQYKDNPVLNGINLAINPNATVAILGPNGAGKSTIVNLILGFYRPQKGQVYADDHLFHELDIVHLRQYIGVVTQDPIIFPGTIFENITYGCPGVSHQQVIQAAEIATAHKFIQQLLQGYDTFVGENGVLLSGGQRQRIAIARALLREPKLLILDEPTNHLDQAAVHRLMNNLKEMNNFPATLIISHDIDIVREAQHVYFLREGRITTNENYETFCFKKRRLPENVKQ